MKDFQIITVSSHRPNEWYYCYDEFFKSVAKHGHEVTVLGKDGGYKGLLSKPKLLKQHILSGGVDSENIMFTDCWDVLFLYDPALAFSLWQREGITFNAEKNLFPRSDLDQFFPDNGSPFKYLNSGFFIGETQAILTLLEHMRLDEIPDDYRKDDGTMHHENDQGNYIQAFTEQPVPMNLDSDCLICQTLHGVTPEEVSIFKEIQLLNKVTNTFPIVAHANGGGKDGPIMPELVKAWKAIL